MADNGDCDQAYDHGLKALDLLGEVGRHLASLPDDGTVIPTIEGSALLVGHATVHALLALEQRLGELVRALDGVEENTRLIG